MMSAPEKINQNTGIPGWLELYDLSLHGDMEAPLPMGAYIRGNISPERQFSPASNIIGTAISKPEGIDSDHGWVELETLTFHRDIEAVFPLPPYVQGEMDENNHFYPDEPYKIRGKVITYDILSDENGKLKATAKLACNFWNRFIIPQDNIVIRLGKFYSSGFVIARAYKPYKHNNTVYGKVEFNTKYLRQFTNYGIAGTIIHEIGHTLGFGWNKWMNLFHLNTGAFKNEFIQKIPELQYMFVETDHGPGTVYSHWDEERFDQELMTGFKDTYEYVLPVTIKVMTLLGHIIAEELTQKTDLAPLIGEVEDVLFTMAEEVQNINFDYSKDTEISEEIYTYA